MVLPPFIRWAIFAPEVFSYSVVALPPSFFSQDPLRVSRTYIYACNQDDYWLFVALAVIWLFQSTHCREKCLISRAVLCKLDVQVSDVACQLGLRLGYSKYRFCRTSDKLETRLIALVS